MRKYVLLMLAAAFVAPTVNAATLLTIDLSTANQITITATGGLSAATVSGSDTTGFYLDGFYAGNPSAVSDTLISGDLTSAANTADGTPALFNTSSDPSGLNVWSYTDDASSDFVAGSLAFTGSATWTVNAEAYTAALAGASSGLIYFPADTPDDLAGATVIGEWEKVAAVPLPAAVWLFGSALFGVGLFRKKS